MKNFTQGVFFTLLFISTSSNAEVQVYRYGPKDVFKNPSYTSNTAECVVDTCMNYKAKCIEDNYCCLCKCTSKFSTYNLTRGRCVSDSSLLSGSFFRFVRNGEILPKIPLYRLLQLKNLGQINATTDIALSKCNVIMGNSQYWSEVGRGKWKPMKKLSKGRLFEVTHEKDGLTLKWIITDVQRISEFQGLVIRLAIECNTLNSTIIFKTWKDFNGKNFIGCRTPQNETRLKVLHTCNKMTPGACKALCRAMGNSVALIRNATKCFCSEASQVKSWNEMGSSCVIPCPGDPLRFCGGKDVYSAYRSMPEWPREFKFSSNGPLDSTKYRCTPITEPSHKRFWNNTYFCSRKVGSPPLIMIWRSQVYQRIRKKWRCVKIGEPEEPISSSWNDNFLCFLHKVDLIFKWSFSGPIPGKECIKWGSHDPHGWKDNYLCAGRPKRAQINASSFCSSYREPSTSKGISPSSSSSTQLQSQYTVNPSPLQTRSGPYIPPISKTTTILRNNGSRNGDDQNQYLMSFYVLVPLVCILSGFLFGVLTILRCRRKRERQRCSNPPREVADFVNPVCSNRTRTETESSKTQHYPRRKSKVDRLPSLPISAKNKQPSYENVLPNVSEISASGSSLSNRDQTIQDEIAQSDNNVYETPVTCRCSDPPNERPQDIQLGETNIVAEMDLDKPIEETRCLRCSPTYESINSYLDPEKLYLEVLP